MRSLNVGRDLVVGTLCRTISGELMVDRGLGDVQLRERSGEDGGDCESLVGESVLAVARARRENTELRLWVFFGFAFSANDLINAFCMRSCWGISSVVTSVVEAEPR